MISFRNLHDWFLNIHQKQSGYRGSELAGETPRFRLICISAVTKAVFSVWTEVSGQIVLVVSRGECQGAGGSCDSLRCFATR